LRPELRHDAAQALGPVAGTELLAIAGDAENEKLFSELHLGVW
jgi:hypothetical protein